MVQARISTALTNNLKCSLGISLKARLVLSTFVNLVSPHLYLFAEFLSLINNMFADSFSLIDQNQGNNSGILATCQTCVSTTQAIK